MALVEILLPKMGESVMEATIITWLKKEGETVEQDESLLEVATDKVDTEVPTTHGGVIKELLAAEGEVVEIGKPIAVIDTEQEEDADTPAPKAEKNRKEKTRSKRGHGRHQT
jgi:2-oxoglutarate dehydrogenase E2 component (dihydrolipoamide succinyltransferase)